MSCFLTSVPSDGHYDAGKRQYVKHARPVSLISPHMMYGLPSTNSTYTKTKQKTGWPLGGSSTTLISAHIYLSDGPSEYSQRRGIFMFRSNRYIFFVAGGGNGERVKIISWWKLFGTLRTLERRGIPCGVIRLLNNSSDAILLYMHQYREKNVDLNWEIHV